MVAVPAGAIATWSLGSGPVLLAVHGGPGFDHTLFRPFLDPLAQRARLVYVDLRGSGGSEHRGALAEIDHARWRDDLELVRQALGVEAWFVLGHSYGGFLAQEYALRYPERTRGMILMSTAPSSAHLSSLEARAPENLPPEARRGWQRIGSGELAHDETGFRAAVLTAMPAFVPAMAPARLAAALAPMRTSAAVFYRALLDLAPRFSVEDRLHEMRAPSLVVNGLEDWETPPTLARDFAAKLPSSTLALLPECGHFPFLERPAACVEAIGEWLATQAG